jgi:copper(I)-binding protein
MQDSIIGVALPAPLGALYRDLMSPYCPGLSLASCPSPQADSLRKAIAVRFNDGESVGAITESLVEHYGPSIRGSPTMDGFGAAAFLAPVLLLVGGGLFISRWLRRNVQKTALLAVVAGSLSTTACATSDDAASGDGASGGAAATVPADPFVTGAWVRTGAAGAVTGAYAVVHNPGADSVRLVAARSDVADTIELHETMQHDGMVGMQPQAALVVPARDSLVLAPGGKHFMLKGLTRDLTVGEQVRFTITFDDGRSVEFNVDVRALDGRTVAGARRGRPVAYATTAYATTAYARR